MGELIKIDSRSPFTEEVCVVRGEFAGMSTNSNGDKKLSMFIERQGRLEVEALADLAGFIVEMRVYRKPKLSRTARNDGHMDLPDAEVPE